MRDLAGILALLGLDQYHDVLVSEGFDSWETVQDITENDLEALNFKLGHRRKLQRYIASQRGINLDQPLASTYPDVAGEKGGEGFAITTGEGVADRGSAPVETKRKYRRHPKPDENAPERPPSAYVLFSNAIREEIKGQDLSFTDIAKLVGQRWQSLSAAEREPYESRAASLKEAYNQQFNEYKKSEQYREYVQYLTEFKAKHGGGGAEGKRPRLEDETSGGSSGSPIVPTLSTLSSTLSSTKSPELSETPQQSRVSEQTGSTPTAARLHARSGPGSPSNSASAQLPQSNISEGRSSSTPNIELSPSHGGIVRDTGRIPSLSGQIPPHDIVSSYFEMSTRPQISDSASSHPLPTQHLAVNSSGSNLPPSKPMLLHSDTTASSVSSVPSTLSYGSGSTAPSQTPMTPRDEPWTPRPDPYNAQHSPWDIPRPVHPPFKSPQGSSIPSFQSWKLGDRGFAHPADQGLRLPPPNTPSSTSVSHDYHPLSLRPQARPPPPFQEQRLPALPRGEQVQGSAQTERQDEGHDSPLDLLARAVDAHNRDRR